MWKQQKLLKGNTISLGAMKSPPTHTHAVFLLLSDHHPLSYLKQARQTRSKGECLELHLMGALQAYDIGRLQSKDQTSFTKCICSVLFQM